VYETGEFEKTFNKSDLCFSRRADIVQATVQQFTTSTRTVDLFCQATRLQSVARETTAIVMGGIASRRFKMDSDQAIATLFHDTHELETFFHSFIGQLAKRRLKANQDVTHLATELKLKVPAVLKGVKITWAGGADTNADQGKEQTLTLARPGVMDALGFTIGCIRIGRFKVCLECGWIYCRVVIWRSLASILNVNFRRQPCRDGSHTLPQSPLSV